MYRHFYNGVICFLCHVCYNYTFYYVGIQIKKKKVEAKTTSKSVKHDDVIVIFVCCKIWNYYRTKIKINLNKKKAFSCAKLQMQNAIKNKLTQYNLVS